MIDRHLSVDIDIDERIHRLMANFRVIAEGIRSTVKNLLSNPQEMNSAILLFIQQLNLMQNRPDCEDIYIDIILILHTRPLDFMQGGAWYPLLDHALKLVQQDDARMAHILFLQSRYAHSIGDFDRSLALCEMAVQKAQATRYALLLAEALEHLGYLYLSKEMSDKALEIVQQQNIIDIIDETDDPIAKYYFNLAQFRPFRRFGMIDDVRQLVKKQDQDVIPFIEDKALVAEWSHAVAILEWFAGNYQKALTHLDHAGQLFKEAQDKRQYGPIADTGAVLFNIGYLKQSEEKLLQAQAWVKQAGNYIGMMKVADLLSTLYKLQGRLDESYEQNIFSLNRAIAAGYTGDITRLRGNTGELLMYKGDFDTALEHLEPTADMINNSKQLLTWTYAAISRVYRLMDELDTAQYYAREALAMAIAHDYHPYKITSLRMLAQCIPDTREALSLYEEALRFIEESSEVRLFGTASCYLEIAHLYDDPEQQKAAWDKGVNLLIEAGAERWLENTSIQSPPLLPL